MEQVLDSLLSNNSHDLELHEMELRVFYDKCLLLIHLVPLCHQRIVTFLLDLGFLTVAHLSRIDCIEGVLELAMAQLRFQKTMACLEHTGKLIPPQ